MEAINNQMGKIISGCHHPQYPKHVIVAYCQAEKMLGIVALQAGIGVDKQYETDMYFCKFSVATSNTRQYINKIVTVTAIMLPLLKSNE